MFSANSGYDVIHILYGFSDGSVMAYCETAGGSMQSSSIVMYRSTDDGAQNGYCALTFDVDTASSGFWRFTTSPSRATTTVTYRDVGSTYHNRAWTFSCTAI